MVLLSVYLYAQMQYTPLHDAADKGHEAVTRALVEAGADVNAKEYWMQRTPLHVAARNGHEAATSALLKGGADVNAKAWVQSKCAVVCLTCLSPTSTPSRPGMCAHGGGTK